MTRTEGAEPTAVEGATGSPGSRKVRSPILATLVAVLVLAGGGAGALVLLDAVSGPPPACPYGVPETPYCSGGGGSLPPNEVVIPNPAGPVGVTSPPGTVIAQATSSVPALPPPAQVVAMPVGALSFTVTGVEPGSTIQVNITLPPGINVNAYYKFQNDVWSDYTSNVVMGNPIVVNLTDNGPGDSDPTSGVISDPGAPVLVDTVPPTITCPAPPTFVLNQPNAQLTATVTDDASNPATPTVTVDVSTAAVGADLHVAVQASDNAGNTASASCAYAVHYKFVGFRPPVKGGSLNSFTAGDDIPIKFQLADFADQPVGNAQSFVGLSSAPLSCTTHVVGSPASPARVKGDVTVSSGQLTVKWQTEKAWKKTCRAGIVALDDGTHHDAWFKF